MTLIMSLPARNTNNLRRYTDAGVYNGLQATQHVDYLGWLSAGSGILLASENHTILLRLDPTDFSVLTTTITTYPSAINGVAGANASTLALSWIALLTQANTTGVRPLVVPHSAITGTSLQSGGISLGAVGAYDSQDMAGLTIGSGAYWAIHITTGKIIPFVFDITLATPATEIPSRIIDLVTANDAPRDLAINPAETKIFVTDRSGVVYSYDV